MNKILKETDKTPPFGNCDCINAHHKGVILGTIDTAMRILSRDIIEIKSDTRKMKMYEHILKGYINGRKIIEETRDKLKKIPDCPY